MISIRTLKMSNKGDFLGFMAFFGEKELYKYRVTSPGGGVLPYMVYIGMCRCEGYGFRAVYSRIGYINQSVWV